MGLADFIVANMKTILQEWVRFAAGLEAGANMGTLALRDHAELILQATVRDMRSPQSNVQQDEKSRGEGGLEGEASKGLDRASEAHGVERFGSGFCLEEVVSEYRALRASVLRLWQKSLRELEIGHLQEIIRFNESMDQSLLSAVASYTKSIDHSRQMFLAILSHDLRNPLACIRMAAQLALRKPRDDEGRNDALSMIEENAVAANRLIGDLIDFASEGLGSEMPLKRELVDLGSVCREVMEGCRVAHPGRRMELRIGEDVVGDWDGGRLRQVVSNLLGNAIQHGSAEGLIKLSVVSEGGVVALSVWNEGEVIPVEMRRKIFDPMVRGVSADGATRRVAGSVGLGLYIVRQILNAHGGTIEVDSMEEKGTTFFVRLPRGRKE